MNKTIVLLLVMALLGYGRNVQHVQISYSLPDSIEKCFEENGVQLRQLPNKPINSDRYNFQVNRNLNPFYLRGDFDNDKKPDYAISIKKTNTEDDGILMCFPHKSQSIILGFQNPLTRSDGHKYHSFGVEAWLVEENGVVIRMHDDGSEESVKLLGEGIVIEWPERGSGLIYWDGEQFRWFHLSG